MTRIATGLCVLAVILGGCGLKGPLYLPEKSEVTIRPGPAATAPTAPTTPATPAEPAAPQQGPAEAKPPAQPEQPPQAPPTGTGRG